MTTTTDPAPLTVEPADPFAPPAPEPRSRRSPRPPRDTRPPKRTRRSRRPTPPARPPLPGWRIVLAATWLGVCVLALWSFGYVSVISNIQHARSQHELYADFRASLAQATAPIGGVITPGTAVAVIDAPQAALHNEVVVEGTTSGVLRAGPGHLRTTPLPGQPGVSVLYGRSMSFGAPFGRLDRLGAGSAITVTTDQGVFHYVVADIRHAGDLLPASVLQAKAALTLVSREGGWSSGRIVYVDAVLHGSPQTDPGGRLATLAPAEKLMAGQTDQLTFMQLVLWLQLFVVVAVAVTYLAWRWSRWQLWLVAVPMVIAVLWGASNTAVQLLPNLL
jgi:sortase A